MDTTESSPLDAAATLERARSLRGQTVRTTRWYALYLLLFAALSFGLAAVFAFVHSARTAVVVTLVFVVMVSLLSIWQARHKTVIRGMTRLHTLVMLGWTVAWTVTVVVGSTSFPGRPGWWLTGGAVMAAAPLVGAVVAYRRTRS